MHILLKPPTKTVKVRKRIERIERIERIARMERTRDSKSAQVTDKVFWLNLDSNNRYRAKYIQE